MLLSELNPNQPFTLRTLEVELAKNNDEECIVYRTDVSLYAVVTKAVHTQTDEYRKAIASPNSVFIQLIGHIDVDDQTNTHTVTLLKRPTGYYELIDGDTVVYLYVDPQKAVYELENTLAPCFKEFLNGIDL
jgi:hypothetical protein